MRNIFTYMNLVEEIESMDSTKEKVIAFVFAPYHEKRVQEIVDQFYDYWNVKFEDSMVHFYWLGYIREAQKEKGRRLIESHLYETVHYDIKVFNQLSQELNTNWNFKYKDTFEIVLVKCKNSNIDFKDTIRIDLENNFSEMKEIKEVIVTINDVMNEYKSFYALKQAIKSMKGLKRLRKIDVMSLIQLGAKKIMNL